MFRVIIGESPNFPVKLNCHSELVSESYKNKCKDPETSSG